MSLAQRAKERLRREFVEQCLVLTEAREFRVEERSSDGAAEVVLELEQPRECLCFQAEPQGGTRWFQYVGTQKCADGSLLVPTTGGGYIAHIVECKATLDSSKWMDVKLQFAGALLRLHGVAAALDLRIENVKCYTAFRKSRLVDPRNVVSRHAMLGGPTPPADAIADHAKASADLRWFGRTVHKDVPLVVEQQDGRDVGRARLAIGD